MADDNIGDFDFVHGFNHHIPDWLFLNFQPQVMPLAVPPAPNAEEQDELDVAYVHVSTDFSIVLFGLQSFSSPWDFAQRVLAAPADSPHITAVHEVTTLWFSAHGWVYTSTRVFNTLLEEWVLTEGTDQTILWYQIGDMAPPAVAVEVPEGDLEDVDFGFHQGHMAAHVPDELWEEVDGDEDGGYATGGSDEAE